MIEFQDIRTESHLLKRLAIVASKKMSPEEKMEQRISFIFGQMKGNISREKIIEILDQQEGRA